MRLVVKTYKYKLYNSKKTDTWCARLNLPLKFGTSALLCGACTIWSMEKSSRQTT